jgi:hypothetical protein
MKFEELVQLILMLGLLVLVLGFGPLLLIWSMNTLFPVLVIPYELSTWAAALVLQVTLSATKSKKKDS